MSATSGLVNQPGRARPLAQVLLAHLRTGDGGRTRAFGEGRDLLVPVVVGDVDHLVEGHRPDACLVAEPVDDLLGVVGAVERVAGRVDPGAGVVPADDQVVCAVVAPYDGVPQRLPGAGEPHRQRQEGQENPVALVVAPGESLVGADAGVVVHVAGLGEADNRVKQEDAVDALGGSLRQLLVSPVEGVPGLEGHDVRVAELGQAGAGLGGRLPQAGEVVVRRKLQHLQRAGYVDPAPAVHLGHERMPHVPGAEHLVRRLLKVPLVRLLDRHYGQEIVAGVPQGDFGIEPYG